MGCRTSTLQLQRSAETSRYTGDVSCFVSNNCDVGRRLGQSRSFAGIAPAHQSAWGGWSPLRYCLRSDNRLCGKGSMRPTEKSCGSHLAFKQPVILELRPTISGVSIVPIYSLYRKMGSQSSLKFNSYSLQLVDRHFPNEYLL